MSAFRRSGLAFVVLILVAVGPAAAQMGLTADQRATATALRDACGADYTRFCTSVRPGGGRILQCLEAHEGELAPSCRAALPQARALRSNAPVSSGK